MTALRLSTRLREATHAQHRVAERSTTMRGLVSGRIDAAGYGALLRNLHALYDALEAGLDAHAAAPTVAPIRLPAVYRRAALAADLEVLCGPQWRQRPVIPTMRDYVERVVAVAREQPALLGAHAYVRYLGDLSGGQLLRGRIESALDLAEGRGTSFYDFGSEEAVAGYKRALRTGLDQLPLADADAGALVAEAQDAFRRHVDFFAELAAA